MPSRRLASRQWRLVSAIMLAGSLGGFALGQALGRQIHPRSPGAGSQTIQSQGELGVGTNAQTAATPTDAQDGGRTYGPAPSNTPSPAHPLVAPPPHASQPLQPAAPAHGSAAAKHQNRGKHGQAHGHNGKHNGAKKGKGHGPANAGHPKAPKPKPVRQAAAGSGGHPTGHAHHKGS